MLWSYRYNFPKMFVLNRSYLSSIISKPSHVNYIYTSGVLSKKKTFKSDQSKKKTGTITESPGEKKVLADKKYQKILDDFDKSVPTRASKVEVTQAKPLPRKGEDMEEVIESAAKELGGNIEKTKKELTKSYNNLMKRKKDPVKMSQSFQRHIIPEGNLDNKELSKKMLSILEESIETKKGRKYQKNLYTDEETVESVISPSTSEINSLKKIFSEWSFEKEEEAVKLKLWDKLEKEALHDLSRQAPRNYFEECIQWTEDGKLWHFPIDNEQGMDEEAKVSFSEHVFLEEHLHPWCPATGPIRRFMNCVVVGLSKNPYYTVEQKKAHIFWFRDYFEKKKELLQDLGVLQQLESNENEELPNKE